MNDNYSKADRTRAFVIESTAAIFNKKGYAGTSLTDLTEATGLTKGSIYGNFKNKEEVALAVFDYNYTKLTSYIKEKVNSADTYYDKLIAYMQVYKRVTRGAITPGGCPVLNTAVEADDTNPLLADRVAKALAKWEKSLSQLMTAGIAAGEFKNDIDVRQSALSIIALIEGGVMMSKVNPSSGAMEMILKTVESIIDNMKK